MDGPDRFVERNLRLITGAFEVLVRNLAFEYQGSGVSYDYLLDYGRSVLPAVIWRCKNPRSLRAYVKKCLPRLMLAEALHRRLPEGAVELDGGEYELAVCDELVDAELDLLELRDILERTLEGEELQIALACSEGHSQREIAWMIKTSPTTVARRIKKLREKLRRALEELRRWEVQYLG